MFCKKCGGLLVRKKVDGKVVFVCSSCGAIEGGVKISQKVESKKKAVEVAKEGEGEIHEKVEAECPKCGNREAYTWMVQTRAADEAPTRFYKCTKCGHVWREYS